MSHAYTQTETAHTELNVDLVEGFDKWLTVQNFSPHTRLNYCGYVRRLAVFIEQASLLEVKRDDVAGFLRYLQEYRRFQPSSLEAATFSLRKFYTFLNMGGVVQRGPPFLTGNFRSVFRMRSQRTKSNNFSAAPKPLAISPLWNSSMRRESASPNYRCSTAKTFSSTLMGKAAAST